eukprot:CFRG4252T1
MCTMGIPEALEAVRERVKTAHLNSAFSNLPKPTLVAVSKTKPNNDVQQAYDAGQRHFGENYMDELVAKSLVFPADVKWHFIGHLQSNKCGLLADVQNLYLWETCGSARTAEKMNKALEKNTRPDGPLRTLLQINTSGENNKHGCAIADCVALAKYIKEECPRLSLDGVMTIGMFGRDPNDTPNPDFVALIKCRDQISSELSIDPQSLQVSMGMSSDFEHAIELGSTNVRVGTTIFGAREKKSTTKA